MKDNEKLAEELKLLIKEVLILEELFAKKSD